MGFLIDADTLVLWAADPAKLAAWSETRGEEELHVSVITADELLRAAQAAEQPGARARRRALVESLLELFPLLALDRATARAHAGLQLAPAHRARLRASDRWLAATCLAHGLTLLTPRFYHFEGIPGLVCQAWDAS
jgi:predicted nucleic acid-binding protein